MRRDGLRLLRRRGGCPARLIRVPGSRPGVVVMMVLGVVGVVTVVVGQCLGKIGWAVWLLAG
ncbi:hypothetical protein [Allokutzneria albata]|uniref:Uncharacterized protein n=1 Tax=Allokutzneria albata TaxID=211114 RepID=A0A1G9UQH1_ALLAB|nr:hypothetical protein [Allokutzneria albata]SDM62178.1 hypothetical protein SAMN04489726_2553 [Allokutzneria albata]